MANRDIVAIGTSAGGVEALLYLAKHLPRTLPASVLVTIHLPSHSASALDDLLTRAGQLPAQFARNGDAVQKGRIYIAPPDCHLLLNDHRVSLGTGPRENNSRPAIDAMLRSVAVCCGARDWRRLDRNPRRRRLRPMGGADMRRTGGGSGSA
jgi:two-component system chemotaxis response regulator CheB